MLSPKYLLVLLCLFTGLSAYGQSRSDYAYILDYAVQNAKEARPTALQYLRKAYSDTRLTIYRKMYDFLTKADIRPPENYSDCFPDGRTAMAMVKRDRSDYRVMVCPPFTVATFARRVSSLLHESAHKIGADECQADLIAKQILRSNYAYAPGGYDHICLGQ